MGFYSMKIETTLPVKWFWQKVNKSGMTDMCAISWWADSYLEFRWISGFSMTFHAFQRWCNTRADMRIWESESRPVQSSSFFSSLGSFSSSAFLIRLTTPIMLQALESCPWSPGVQGCVFLLNSFFLPLRLVYSVLVLVLLLAFVNIRIRICICIITRNICINIDWCPGGEVWRWTQNGCREKRGFCRWKVKMKFNLI